MMAKSIDNKIDDVSVELSAAAADLLLAARMLKDYATDCGFSSNLDDVYENRPLFDVYSILQDKAELLASQTRRLNEAVIQYKEEKSIKIIDPVLPIKENE